MIIKKNILEGYLNIGCIKKNNEIIPYFIYYVSFDLKIEKFIFYKENTNIIDELISFLLLYNIKNYKIFVKNLDFYGFLILNFLTKSNKYKFDVIIYNLKIYHISVTYNKKKIKIWCLTKLFSIKLDQLSIKLNNKNLVPQPLFFNNNSLILEKNNFKSETEYFYYLNLLKSFNFDELGFINYLNQENSLMYINILKNFKKFLKIFSLNIYKNNIYTLSGFAYKCFFKNFNKHNISDRIPDYLDLFIRDSYFGGRCEVFQNCTNFIDNEVLCIDFNGMYSQCMEEEYPVYNDTNKGEFIFNKTEIDEIGFYEITYKSNLFIPILPHKNKSNGKLMFVNGVNRGVFWYEEILLFLKEGGEIISIHTSYIFKKKEYVFLEFIKIFKDYKNSDHIYNNISKLVVNSLYGKFGMKKKNDKTILTDDVNFFIKNNNELITKINQLNNYFVIEGDFSKTYSFDKSSSLENNVIYASIITAKARIKLFLKMKELMKKNFQILYCDTDSIFFKKLINVDYSSCNFTRIVELNIQDCVFIAPKTYGIKYTDNTEKIVIKGVNDFNINFNSLKECFYKNNSNFIFINQNIFYKNNFNLVEKNVNIKISLNAYNKRKFDINKINTTPYIIIDNNYF